MENKSHALITGLFTIVLGTWLALAAMWLNRDSTERVPYELVTRASIAGLTPQSAVRYRGLEVGKVEHIGFDPLVPGQILVRIVVAKGTPLTRSTFATLGYQGVTGLAYIQLDDDGKDATPLTSTPQAVARMTISPGLLDTVTSRGQEILVQVEELARRMNKLLEPANQKILTDTLSSLDAAARDIDKLGAELQPTLARLPELAGQMQATLARLPELAGQMQTTLVAVGKTSEDFSGLALRLQERGGALDRASASVEQLASIADRLATTISTGTVPRVNALVDSAASSARGVTRLVERIGEQPQSLIFGSGEIAPGPGERGYERGAKQ